MSRYEDIFRRVVSRLLIWKDFIMTDTQLNIRFRCMIDFAEGWQSYESLTQSITPDLIE